MTTHSPAPKAATLLEKWQAPPPLARELDLSFLPDAARDIPRIFIPILRRLLRIDELMGIFQSIPPSLSAQEFSARGLGAMGVTIDLDDGFADAVPREGPLVIVCNHPLGGIDGMALMAALLPLRPDLRMLVNLVLGIFPDLRSCCLPLDVLSGTPEAMAGNIASLRIAGAHLKQGGAMAFFPSGTVSHWQRGKGVTDPPWQDTAARMAKKYGATVVPVFCHAKNSMLFSMAGLVHPMARTLLLPREMWRSQRTTVRFSIGRAIEPSSLELLETTPSITAYFRMRTYALGRSSLVPPAKNQPEQRPMEPVAPSHSTEELTAAIDALPEDCLLLREGNYAIYCVVGNQSPVLLEELGSAREATFRLAGEGSGFARDLDEFDLAYHHLLLWNEKDQCLAGAYRLGKVRDLLAAQGPAGLYTNTLFQMNDAFFKKYGDGLELGRALVSPRYQREYAPLMLLWKGIGQFLLRHKEIHCLFGPVSLSLDYDAASLLTAVDYLQTQCGSRELSSMVKGRTKPDKYFRKGGGFSVPDSLSYNGLVRLVKEIEGGKGIPVLFKHYLKLGGKIGAFHMDVSFNTLDAFLLMDLADSPLAMLERYMTREGAAEFLARWKQPEG